MSQSTFRSGGAILRPKQGSAKEAIFVARTGPGSSSYIFSRLSGISGFAQELSYNAKMHLIEVCKLGVFEKRGSKGQFLDNGLASTRGTWVEGIA